MTGCPTHALSTLPTEHADLRALIFSVDDAGDTGARDERCAHNEAARVSCDEQHLVERDLVAGLVPTTIDRHPVARFDANLMTTLSK